MGIELLEAGSMHSATLGWVGSRSLREAASADHIAGIDASVNELPTALFYFRDMMIVERELFVTPRNHVIWARTSRVDDPRLFTVPKGFEREAHKEIRHFMQHLHDSGVHQDQWRLHLPMCAQTSWTARISFRDAVKAALYLYEVSRHIEGDNLLLAQRLEKTAAELVGMLPKAFGLSGETVHKAIETYKTPKLITEVDFGFGLVRKEFGEFVSMQFEIPVATRAQLVRHREVMVADNFINLLCQPRSEQLPISAQVTVQATALRGTWQHVLGNRTCWMAQADLWAPLASLYGVNVGGLPCAEGVCPYAEDAKQRVAGNDPGAPCPRYANLTNTTMTAVQHADANLQIERTPVAARPLWNDELKRVKVQEHGVPCPTCTTPKLCIDEDHCDKTFNGYR